MNDALGLYEKVFIDGYRNDDQFLEYAVRLSNRKRLRWRRKRSRHTAKVEIRLG